VTESPGITAGFGVAAAADGMANRRAREIAVITITLLAIPSLVHIVLPRSFVFGVVSFAFFSVFVFKLAHLHKKRGDSI
jgi:hypothetical protein